MANGFYIQDQWITDLKLSGNDLLIFARLASFTTNVGGYNGSIEWLGRSIGVAKRTAIDIIARLEDSGQIERGGDMIKCVFRPITRGEKSAPKSAEIAPKKRGAESAPNGAKSARKSAESAPKYNNKINTQIKCSNSVIVPEDTHTSTHTDFLFEIFKSKIANEMDESCIRNIAKKIANLEQAQLFADYVTARRSGLHLGMLCKLFDSIFQCACEWDAKGRPMSQPKPQPPQPTPQMLPQQEMHEIGAKKPEIYAFNLWRAQINDCIKKHPKTAKKAWNIQNEILSDISGKFPAPCDMQLITNYIEELL